MSETIHPYIESDADDKETDKKDKKRRAERTGGLLASQAVERTPAERPLKLGSELLKPLSVEVPNVAGAGHTKAQDAEKAREGVADPVHTDAVPEQMIPANDLQRLQTELAALYPEAEDDDDEPDRPKKAAKVTAPREDVGPEAPTAEVSKVEHDHTEAAFEEIAAAPELADLATLRMPEAATSPVRETPVAVETSQSDRASTVPIPEVYASDDPDAAFNGIVEHTLGEVPPGQTRFHEQAPGEPPIDAGSGDALPPVPPTIEGGGWGGGDGEAWQHPAGGLGSGRVAEAVSVVDARRELDDLYHTSRENGLAAAVGLLGLGLVIEHIWAKRRDKRLKKGLTAQGRQLKKTNQTVQQQHYTLQATQRKLERLQTVTAAQVPGTEAVAAAAAVGGIAERHATKLTSAQEHVLANRLEHSRELGVAMARNPELQKEAVTREQQQQAVRRQVERRDIQHQELLQAYESASSTMVSQEQQINSLQHEVSYERLQGKYGDNGSVVKRSSQGVDSDASGMPMLPMPQEQLPSGMAAEHLLEAHGSPDKPARTAAAMVTPVAIATILVILAAVLVMAFIR